MPAETIKKYGEEAKQLMLYVAILIIFLMALEGKVAALKNEINNYGQVQCQVSKDARVIDKYNNLVNALVQIEIKKNRAALAARFRADHISLPPQDCSQPLLK